MSSEELTQFMKEVCETIDAKLLVGMLDSDPLYASAITEHRFDDLGGGEFSLTAYISDQFGRVQEVYGSCTPSTKKEKQMCEGVTDGSIGLVTICCYHDLDTPEEQGVIHNEFYEIIDGIDEEMQDISVYTQTVLKDYLEYKEFNTIDDVLKHIRTSMLDDERTYYLTLDNEEFLNMCDVLDKVGNSNAFKTINPKRKHVKEFTCPECGCVNTIEEFNGTGTIRCMLCNTVWKPKK